MAREIITITCCISLLLLLAVDIDHNQNGQSWVCSMSTARHTYIYLVCLTLLGLCSPVLGAIQSITSNCPPNGTAVLKGLNNTHTPRRVCMMTYHHRKMGYTLIQSYNRRGATAATVLLWKIFDSNRKKKSCMIQLLLLSDIKIQTCTINMNSTPHRNTRRFVQTLEKLSRTMESTGIQITYYPKTSTIHTRT